MPLLRNQELWQFPEDENWNQVDSPKLQRLADELALAIREDLRSRTRLLTPGLRLALQYLAEVEEGRR